MAYTIKNNFPALKAEFTKETGLQVTKETMALYIAYYQARSADTSMQLLAALLQEMANNKMGLPH